MHLISRKEVTMITPKDIELAYKIETGSDHSRWDSDENLHLPTIEYTTWLFEKTRTYFNLIEDLKTISNPEDDRQ